MFLFSLLFGLTVVSRALFAHKGTQNYHIYPNIEVNITIIHLDRLASKFSSMSKNEDKGSCAPIHKSLKVISYLFNFTFWKIPTQRWQSQSNTYVWVFLFFFFFNILVFSLGATWIFSLDFSKENRFFDISYIIDF